MRPKFAIISEAFEDSDYCVTIRPEAEPVYKAVVLGKSLSKHDADVCSEWLKTAINELFIIADNTNDFEDAYNNLRDYCHSIGVNTTSTQMSNVALKTIS